MSNRYVSNKELEGRTVAKIFMDEGAISVRRILLGFTDGTYTSITVEHGYDGDWNIEFEEPEDCYGLAMLGIISAEEWKNEVDARKTKAEQDRRNCRYQEYLRLKDEFSPKTRLEDEQ